MTVATNQTDWLALVRSHLDKVIANGLDVYGPQHTAMWMASLDVRTGAYPVGRPKADAGQRVYRQIAAPAGCTLYWDQPALVAAHAVTGLTGDARFADAADAYVRDFLARCIDVRGLPEWGNHRYWDAFTDQVVHFEGGDHEMRPIPGAWELLWRIDPAATERAIRQLRLHLVDERTGQFNRHDSGRPGCAFLEAGGILVEAFCWLAGRTGDQSLADPAMRIARYSFGHRGSANGLVENNPAEARWDKFVCTTEVGLWAGSLLRAADYSGVEEFQSMARDAMAAWLHFGWDAAGGRYFGQLRVADGSAVRGIMTGPDPWPYQPDDYADIWNALFPTHDYPLALAETSAQLYRRTGEGIFAEAVDRWAAVIDSTSVPRTARAGRGAYAELFGRAIHFLLSAADVTGRRAHAEAAARLAGQARDILWAGQMFRSHAGEDRCDAVDGVGYLLLALIRLATGRPVEGMGFGF